jgi:hypothetical protein
MRDTGDRFGALARTGMGASAPTAGARSPTLWSMKAFALVLALAAGFVQAGEPRANFKHETPSAQARHVADWVVHSGDNVGLPFVVVDKIQARVFVFHATGTLRGAAAALLGLAVGDDSVPGIGEREMSSIRPDERTTPAGRFVAQLGTNFDGKDILWIDYDAAFSMHRVVTSNAKERRAYRLATETVADNRISFGCINVPAGFYDRVVRPAFTGHGGIVYVLPETRPARAVFASYDVDELHAAR